MIRNEVQPKLRRAALLICLNFLLVLTALAKNVDDVVVLKNGDRMTGEIKGLQSGARENYSETIGTPKSTNADAIAGTDFATFRFSRTDIRSRFSLFPSLTTPGRMRLQANSDLRIKIVKDLWWGFHIYENFDSKPPVRADKNDLGVSTSLGWKF
jgi:hypothetical protein